MSAATLIEGYGLKQFAELDSTNEEARRLALAGEKGPLWVTARRQTGGRGRQGRPWHSEEGNLFATLLLTPSRLKGEWAQLSFAAAVAVADMAARFTPAIALKWPNDVLAEGRKISGILLESAGESLLIGVGINLALCPADTEFPAVSLAQLMKEKPPAPDAALALLAEELARWYEIWESSGFAPVRDAWLARAAGVGGRIRARLPDREFSGVFEGIDEQGALLLNDGTRTHIIAAGDVFFG